MMRSHQDRPLQDELQELYAIALREHGPQSRASRIIGRALNEVRAGVQPAQPRPRPRDHAPSATREPR